RECCCCRSCRCWRRRGSLRLCAISPASVEIDTVGSSAPDDHLTASPNCRVNVSGTGRVGGAGGCPAISAGIVSPASVQSAAVSSAPDDHLTASPNCRVLVSRTGRISGGGGCPAVGARIVSPASVQLAAVISAPDDHLT